MLIWDSYGGNKFQNSQSRSAIKNLVPEGKEKWRVLFFIYLLPKPRMTLAPLSEDLLYQHITVKPQISWEKDYRIEIYNKPIFVALLLHMNCVKRFVSWRGLKFLFFKFFTISGFYCTSTKTVFVQEFLEQHHYDGPFSLLSLYGQYLFLIF